MHAHDGALAVQIVAAGRATSESSRVPARTNIRCGRDSASLNRCVPHIGQKRLCIVLPLSAILTKSRVSPLMDIPAEGKQTPTAVPCCYDWHTRHQHSRVIIGWASVRYRTARHRHPPVIISWSSDRLWPLGDGGAHPGRPFRTADNANTVTASNHPLVQNLQKAPDPRYRAGSSARKR
jgi:hypothetical protein